MKPQAKAAPQYGRLAGNAITGNSAGTANAILTLTADASILQIRSSLDQDVSLTLNGVEFDRLESGDAGSVDLRPANVRLRNGDVLGAFNHGAAPGASTSIRMTVW